MSHVGNGEYDFEDMDMLDEETKEKVKQVRIEARDIIDRLEPRHITSWADLLFKLQDSLATAKQSAELLDPVFGERRKQRLLEEQEEKEEKRLEGKAAATTQCVMISLFIMYGLIVYLIDKFRIFPENYFLSLVLQMIIPGVIIVFSFPVVVFFTFRKFSKLKSV